MLNHYIELFTRRRLALHLNSAFVSIVSILSLESERLPLTLWHGYALGWKSNLRRCSDRDSIPWNSVVPGTVGNRPGTEPG